MKILKILGTVGKALIKPIPGSSIITKVKDTFDKTKEDHWVELVDYLVGGLIVWYSLSKGIIGEEVVERFIKSIF